MNRFAHYIISFILFLFLAPALILSGCGPSSEERERQRVEDSLQLEADRRELLERANRMFESSDPEDDEAPNDNED